mmetsp:Transcript_32988/g.79787  ORF Transcript_32988/g.79787 Transcript_32988/m.79787 type:complete len:112 (+) Transcript_32988:1506-1841(+)
MFSKKGLDAGVSVGESIMKKSHKKAVTRESVHKTYSQAPVSRVSSRGVSFSSGPSDSRAPSDRALIAAADLPDKSLIMRDLDSEFEESPDQHPEESHTTSTNEGSGNSGES